MESTFGEAGFVWGDEVQQERGEVTKFSPKSFMNNYREQADKAVITGGRFVELFINGTKKILGKFLELAKQAVEIAISKFLIELCAMIIAGMSAAMAAKHGKNVDISTPGVIYNKPGSTQPNNQGNQNQGSLWSPQGASSPFDSGWGRSNW